MQAHMTPPLQDQVHGDNGLRWDGERVMPEDEFDEAPAVQIDTFDNEDGTPYGMPPRSYWACICFSR
jgi:hypothetical protein